MEEVTGECRKLHKKMNFMTSTRIYNVFLVCDEIKEDKKGRACCRHEGDGICLHDFGGEACWKETTWNS